MRGALEKIEGVVEVKTEPDKREVRVKHFASKAKVETLLKAMKDAGYEGKLVKVEPSV